MSKRRKDSPSHNFMNSRTPWPKQQQQVVIVAVGQAIWYPRGLRTFLGPTLVLLQVLETPIFYRSGRTEVRSAEAAKRKVRRRDRTGRSSELRSRRKLVVLPEKSQFFRSIFQKPDF